MQEDSVPVGPTTTHHTRSIDALCALRPNAQRNGFGKKLRGLKQAEYLQDMFAHSKEWVSSIRIVPDAFEIDHDESVVRVFEIVDTCDISQEKFEKMAELAFALDEDYWTLELVRIDKFGHRIFNVVNAYTLSMVTKQPWHFYSTEHINSFDYSDFIADGLRNGLDRAVPEAMVRP